jgi:hypothetical protein
VPRPILKRIHVNQHVIRSNVKGNLNEPPIRVKTKGQNISASAVEIAGPSKLVYRPEKPLPCGARLWIETYAPVNIEASGNRQELI